MSKLAFSLFCGLLPIFLASQPLAPNFTITDSNGQQHRLYEDYLDQGKTVVIKFFFTTCPPCNAMAPLMEPFYQEWGGGNADVEFISLSIMTFDMNANVAAYKLAKGHTFPGAGNNGGSISAAQPYLNNMFGSFTGTPTFAVIAPDRTVIFNPRGNNHEATIDSVDVAIRSTGAHKPPVPFTVSGVIADKLGHPIKQAVVHVQGISGTADTSDANGQFSFIAQIEPRLNYKLVASKDINYSNGVTTFDLILIQKQILAITPFTEASQFLSSDANHSSGITTQDIILFRKILLHTVNYLDDNGSWLFIDPNYEFINPEYPFPEVYNSQAAFLTFNTKTTAPLNLLGIKIGDPNNSADPQQ